MSKKIKIILAVILLLSCVNCDNLIKSNKDVELSRMLSEAVRIQTDIGNKNQVDKSSYLSNFHSWELDVGGQSWVVSKDKHPTMRNAGNRREVYYYYLNRNGELYYYDKMLIFVPTGRVSEQFLISD